jgi:hypothetical protein
LLRHVRWGQWETVVGVIGGSTSVTALALNLALDPAGGLSAHALAFDLAPHLAGSLALNLALNLALYLAGSLSANAPA